MRDLTLQIISKSVKCNFNDALCMVVNHAGIGNYGTQQLPTLFLIDLSINDLRNLNGLFFNFPSAWWIYLSNNQVNLYHYII